MDSISVQTFNEMLQLIEKVGLLPLLKSSIAGYSADDFVDEDCRYVVYPDGGWDWPLWKWKGPLVTEGKVVYGKFFRKKAGFISRRWWRDFYNYRRSLSCEPQLGSVEEVILSTLRHNGSMIARDLRAACGFTGTKMRSKFDAYITRLQMECRIVTQDFIYPKDRNGREYGWGWSLLTLPELFFEPDELNADCSAEESFSRLLKHMKSILPTTDERLIMKLLLIK